VIQPVHARRFDALFLALVTLTTAAIVSDIFIVFLVAPTEARMGIVQKIFYFHVPSAYAMYLGAAACFAGSVAYLANGSDIADAVARAGAEAACAFGWIVMTTGPLWGAKAWGAFWTWDPRLTTALLSLLIYVAYLVLRAFAGDGDGERRFAAALGVLGAANLPIIHYSVQKWGGQHPVVITGNGGGLQDASMRTALGIGFVAFTLLVGLIVWMRTRIEIASSRLLHAEQAATDLELQPGDLT
jgi:heme exporter protein C